MAGNTIRTDGSGGSSGIDSTAALETTELEVEGELFAYNDGGVSGTSSNSGVGSTDGYEQQRVAATRSIDTKLASMTVEQKVRALLMDYGDVNVSPRSGAVIVNQTHLTATGTSKLQQGLDMAEARTGIPVLVGADQEGGSINRLKNSPAAAGVRFPSPKQMASMTLEQIRAEGEKTGRALLAAGVNCLLGPCLDSASPGSLMDRMNRSFGATPEEVTQRVQAFVEGLRRANPGLAIIGKHYPGYNVRGNSDIAVVSDPSTAAQVEARAKPFTAVKGLDGVMMNSIRYPEVDDQPACFSKKIIGGLREKSPDAVVMTDDLYASALLSPEVRAYKDYQILSGRARTDEASAAELQRLVAQHPKLNNPEERRRLAAQATLEVKENAKKAFLAGCDMLLIMDSSKSKAAVQGLIELMQEHPELEAKLTAAARRVMLMAERTRSRPSPSQQRTRSQASSLSLAPPTARPLNQLGRFAPGGSGRIA